MTEYRRANKLTKEAVAKARAYRDPYKDLESYGEKQMYRTA